MKRVLRAVVVVVCLSAGAQAESKGGRWLRRLTLGASCVTSFWDVQTTRTAVRYGAQEGNAFFANGRGEPRWGRMIGVKVGLCAGMFVGQEMMDRKRTSAGTDYAWSSVNTALAIRNSVASLHNMRVANQVRRQPAGPLSPE